MVTSVGASIDVHFCNGEIYSLAVNANAEKCAGFESQDHQKDQFSIDRPHCCDDFTAYFQSDVDSGNDEVSIQYSLDATVIPFQHEVRIPNCVAPMQLCHFYNPPEYEEDLLTLFSVFRI
jgi:hypothetical protein